MSRVPTITEDAIILALMDDRMTAEEICRFTGRAPSSVRIALNRMAAQGWLDAVDVSAPTSPQIIYAYKLTQKGVREAWSMEPPPDIKFRARPYGWGFTSLLQLGR